MVVEGLTVVERVNKLLTDAVNYSQYRLLKKSAQYEDDVGHEQSRMTKEDAVQMKKSTLGCRDPSRISSFYKT